MFICSRSNRAYPESIRNYVVENYFELLKCCSAEPFSAEMTVLVCEPVIHAVAYCENKAFFKQSSEALIQGLLPGGDCEDEACAEGCGEGCGDNCKMSGCEDEDESVSEDSNDSQISEGSDEEDSMQECSEDEEAEFDSEEFDNIEDDVCDENEQDESGPCCSGDEHDHCEEEEGFIFDYSLLAKFIFDFGAREDVLVRNRRFLYELSQIIEEVSTGAMDSCCQSGDACCN